MRETKGYLQSSKSLEFSSREERPGSVVVTAGTGCCLPNRCLQALSGSLEVSTDAGAHGGSGKRRERRDTAPAAPLTPADGKGISIFPLI